MTDRFSSNDVFYCLKNGTCRVDKTASWSGITWLVIFRPKKLSSIINDGFTYNVTNFYSTARSDATQMFRPSTGKFAYAFNISTTGSTSCLFYNGQYVTNSQGIDRHMLVKNFEPFNIETLGSDSAYGVFLDDTDGIGASNNYAQHFNYVLFDKPTS